MKKLLIALAIVVSVLVGLALVSPVYAAVLDIQMSGMNWSYDGYALRDVDVSGDSVAGDPLTAAIFKLDGAEVGQLTDVWFDSTIYSGSLPVNDTRSTTDSWLFNSYFYLYTHTSGGDSQELLKLEITSQTFTTTRITFGLGAINLIDVNISGEVGSSAWGSGSQDLPFGLELDDPITLSFSGGISSPTFNSLKTAYTSFSNTNDTNGDIEGAGWGPVPDPPTTPVPEPSTLLLLGSGLVGLMGYGRRRLRK